MDCEHGTGSCNFNTQHLQTPVDDGIARPAFFVKRFATARHRDHTRRHPCAHSTRCEQHGRQCIVPCARGTTLFFFDAEKAPLSDGLPSRWHHIGFVVDNLDAAYRHLAHHAQLRRERVGDGSGSISSDFTLLERNERWSLYCHYRNGDSRLMIQLSEIKTEDRGFVDPHSFTEPAAGSPQL